MWLSQSETCLPHNSFEARYVCIQNSTPEFGQAVVSPPGVIVPGWARSLLHQSLNHELLEVVVESTGPQLVLLIRLTGHLPHDPVSVTDLRRKTKQNVKSCRSEGQERP